MNGTEKNKKLFSSGGIFVDVFIGFLIAACIAGIVFRCFIYDPHVPDETEQSYMVYFEIIDPYDSYAKYLGNGDVVYDSTTRLRIGTLAAHENHAENSAVSVQQTEQDAGESLTVRGVIRSVSGELEQGTLVIDGSYMLTPGQVLELYTDTVSVNVCILQIAELSDE